MANSTERTPLLANGGETSPAEEAQDPSQLDPTKVPTRRRYCILAAIWTGVFLGALDTTIVATLVGSIASDFGASNEASWLATSYLLATATFTPLYGRLADILGRRWAHGTALILFLFGTLLCGLSNSMGTLIAARLIAGMGGGGVMTTSSIIASDLVPLQRRGFYQGLANICFGAGAGLGGPVGGLITDTIGWRWAFLIQVPILCIALTLVFSFVHYRLPGQAKSKREMAKRIDYAGSATLIICIGSLLLALSFKNNEQYDWSHPLVWAPLVVFAVFLVGFGFVEAKFSREPVLPMRLLAMRSPFFIAWMNFIVSWNSFSVLYMFPLYFETVMLVSAASAGAHLVPNSVMLSLGSLFAGWYMRRTGKYYWLIVTSAVLPLVAFVMMAVMTRLDDGGGPALQWISILPSGFGISSLITALLIALISAVDRADMAVGTGISYLARYTGQVIGVAVSSAVLQAVLAKELSRRITGPDSAQLIDEIRHTSSMVKDLPPDIRASAVAAYSQGLFWVFVMNGTVSLVGVLCVLPLKEYPLPDTFEEEEEQQRRRREENGAAR